VFPKQLANLITDVHGTSLAGEQRVFCRGHTWSKCFQNIFQIVVREEWSGLRSCSRGRIFVHKCKGFHKRRIFSGQRPNDSCHFHCPDFLKSPADVSSIFTSVNWTHCRSTVNTSI
jgi:hypothetical protein